MKVKNIKSFIEFYKNLEITTSITNTTRDGATASLRRTFELKINQKKFQFLKNIIKISQNKKN